MKKLILFFFMVAFLNYVYPFPICQEFNFPAMYQLGLDLIFSEPTDPNDAAICITASGIIADGLFHRIAQINDVENFAGIRVAPGLNNITIQNFVIDGCTGPGIEIGAGCSNIKILNNHIARCDAGGVIFLGEEDNPIFNVVMNNCNLLSCTGQQGEPAYGLHILFSEDMQINNCFFKDNDAQDNNGYGALIESSTDCFISNCRAIKNGGNLLAAGIELSQSDHCFLKNCISSENVARDPNGRSVGFLITNSSRVNINSCTAKGNNNLLHDAYGFELNGGHHNDINSGISQDNRGARQGAGFLLTNGEHNSAVRESFAQANDGTTGSGYGILLDGATDCLIKHNELTNNRGEVQGVGLADTTIDTTNLIIDNFAFVNTTTAFEVVRTIGELPVLTVPVYDFAELNGKNKYVNVYFLS